MTLGLPAHAGSMRLNIHQNVAVTCDVHVYSVMALLTYIIALEFGVYTGGRRVDSFFFFYAKTTLNQERIIRGCLIWLQCGLAIK